MPSVGFEPTISADERPQTYALDRAATETGTTTTTTSTTTTTTANTTTNANTTTTNTTLLVPFHKAPSK